MFLGIKDVSKTNQRRSAGVFDVGERGDFLLFTGEVFRLFIALFYGLFRYFLLSGELCVHE